MSYFINFLRLLLLLLFLFFWLLLNIFLLNRLLLVYWWGTFLLLIFFLCLDSLFLGFFFHILHRCWLFGPFFNRLLSFYWLLWGTSLEIFIFLGLFISRLQWLLYLLLRFGLKHLLLGLLHNFFLSLLKLACNAEVTGLLIELVKDVLVSHELDLEVLVGLVVVGYQIVD
jgi:hypothetical protein